MESALHIAPAGFAVVLVVVAVGAAVQGAVGFGANLLAAPVLAVVEPQALPATLMLLILPLAVAMGRREPHGVDWWAVGWLMAGRLPGTLAGALVVAVVAADTLSVLAGLAVLAAVATSLFTTTVPVTRATTFVTGVASGAMGTATSIGGPPLALLYQHREGHVLRGTLAAVFGLGTVLSLVVLAATGAVAGWHVGLALALLPGTACGIVASGPLARTLDGAWLRPAVLAVAAVAAAAAVIRGLA
ncbi:MAG: sulfite exporter TauE/SafE family protein [Acidimicrobiales bacterium]|nr:sulfite exporter TauE/SafE family protein [Acidimicrobiales bacterium]